MTATVKIDGEWYVSGFYTLADYALKDAGAPGRRRRPRCEAAAGLRILSLRTWPLSNACAKATTTGSRIQRWE
jgi:hypothetical protein